MKIKMQKPSQEPPVSSKAPNQDLKDMNQPLCYLKFKLYSVSDIVCSLLETPWIRLMIFKYIVLPSQHFPTKICKKGALEKLVLFIP